MNDGALAKENEAARLYIDMTGDQMNLFNEEALRA
jgi:hypothetical protein